MDLRAALSGGASTVAGARIEGFEGYGAIGASDYDDTIDVSTNPADQRDSGAMTVGIYAGSGNDTVLGGLSGDLVWGDAGDDNLSGNEGDDTLRGDAGEDVLEGGAGNDRLIGGYHSDRLDGGSGNDVLLGGEDLNSGDRSADELIAGDGDDHV